MGEKFTTQRATKVAANGFPDAVGCHRTIELTRAAFTQITFPTNAIFIWIFLVLREQKDAKSRQELELLSSVPT